jgi:hypothetical protein
MQNIETLVGERQKDKESQREKYLNYGKNVSQYSLIKFNAQIMIKKNWLPIAKLKEFNEQDIKTLKEESERKMKNHIDR